MKFSSALLHAAIVPLAEGGGILRRGQEYDGASSATATNSSIDIDAAKDTLAEHIELYAGNHTTADVVEEKIAELENVANGVEGDRKPGHDTPSQKSSKHPKSPHHGGDGLQMKLAGDWELIFNSGPSPILALPTFWPIFESDPHLQAIGGLIYSFIAQMMSHIPMTPSIHQTMTFPGFNDGSATSTVPSFPETGTLTMDPGFTGFPFKMNAPIVDLNDDEIHLRVDSIKPEFDPSTTSDMGIFLTELGEKMTSMLSKNGLPDSKLPDPSSIIELVKVMTAIVPTPGDIKDISTEGPFSPAGQRLIGTASHVHEKMAELLVVHGAPQKVVEKLPSPKSIALLLQKFFYKLNSSKEIRADTVEGDHVEQLETILAEFGNNATLILIELGFPESVFTIVPEPDAVQEIFNSMLALLPQLPGGGNNDTDRAEGDHIEQLGDTITQLGKSVSSMLTGLGLPAPLLDSLPDPEMGGKLVNDMVSMIPSPQGVMNDPKDGSGRRKMKDFSVVPPLFPFGVMGDFIRATAPPVVTKGPLGEILNKIVPSSQERSKEIPNFSEVVMVTTFVDDSILVVRNKDRPQDVFVWKRST